MKGIIIYNSKTGFTKRYAQWLAEELQIDCIPYEKRKKIDPAQYDMLIYGGNVHAGSISGLKWLKACRGLKQDRCAVFATGAMPAESEGIEEMLKQNLGDTKIKGFYFPGGLNYESMSAGSRLIMKMFRKMINGKKDKTPQEEQMAAALGHSYDITDRAAMRPLVYWGQSLFHRGLSPIK